MKLDEKTGNIIDLIEFNYGQTEFYDILREMITRYPEMTVKDAFEQIGEEYLNEIKTSYEAN